MLYMCTSCTCLNTDGVGVIRLKACDVVFSCIGSIRTILSVVVCIHPVHVVADPVLVALHWSVGPGEGNAGINTAVNVFNSGLLQPCSSQKCIYYVHLNLIQHIHQDIYV